jgi:hypothetical protein
MNMLVFMLKDRGGNLVETKHCVSDDHVISESNEINTTSPLNGKQHLFYSRDIHTCEM